MKYRNAGILIAAITLGPLAIFASMVLLDVRLLILDPTGKSTISEQMARLCYAYPVVPFGLGCWITLCFGVSLALAAHFFWNVTKPSEQEALADAERRAAELLADNLTLSQQKRSAEEQWAEYRRQTVDLQFKLSDCLAGHRDAHGFPPFPRIADTPEK